MPMESYEAVWTPFPGAGLCAPSVLHHTQLKQLNAGHIWAAVQSPLGGRILPLVSFKNMPFFKVED